jgi:hypothetical protein
MNKKLRLKINIRNSGNGEILETHFSNSGRIKWMITLKSMLKNGYIDGIRDWRSEDSRTETSSSGFGT